MEDENKEQYFRYYQTRAPTADSYSRKKQPFKRYNNSKILPHITEEYNYRITNYLLIKKIISPKRDKTIMQSLEALSRKYHSAHGKLNTASRDNFRRKTKLKSYENSRVEQNGSEFEHSFKQQPRAKTALKEGKIARRKLQKRKTETEFYQRSRITENKVQNNLYQTSQSQDRTSNSHSIKQSKEDQLLMISSNNNKWKQNYPLHGRCFKNHPTGYGNGPTVLLLTHLKIEINPPIKPQTLIQLQLIQRAAFTRSYLNVTCENTEKAVKADPFKYCELPKQGDSSSGIKFCIRLCKIGDFVPLRIWKYCGVQSILVGTIDLPLNTYSQQENEQSNKKIELVQKKDNELMFKRIFHGQVQHNLSKNKMLQTDSVALVKYKVYPKRFYRRQDKIIINQ